MAELSGDKLLLVSTFLHSKSFGKVCSPGGSSNASPAQKHFGNEALSEGLKWWEGGGPVHGYSHGPPAAKVQGGG